MEAHEGFGGWKPFFRIFPLIFKIDQNVRKTVAIKLFIITCQKTNNDKECQ